MQLNYTNNEIVSSPTVLISGTSPIPQGIVTFTNDNNKVFPPCSFEINNGHFKALVHVAPEENNEFVIEIAANGRIDDGGYARFDSPPDIVEVETLKLEYKESANKPVHLCLVVGHDSQGFYDMPQYRLQRGEAPSLDAAVRKLKVAARLMQAYTQDEMRAAGFSNRTFPFAEESVSHQGVFGYNVESPTPHKEVKIHVLRSPKSVAEIRDINWAQQNPNASDAGGLFSHALDLAKDYFQPQGGPVQVAAIYLDSVYDRQRDMILAHAALGGGGGDVKLAIFGSHGIHSWPNTFAGVSPAFVDATELSKNEVANDCNQCGTSWECLNITLGAFMHEIGHSLGCPHQVNGVMLRDYIWFNRSFMTREAKCLRENTGAQVIGQGGWDKVCHWHRLDLVRFLYHGSFALPVDDFAKVSHSVNGSADAPVSYNDGDAAIFRSSSGIYLVELISDDLARQHIEFLPRGYGGPGPVGSYRLALDQGRQMMGKDDFSVRVLGMGGDFNVSDYKKHCSNDNSLRTDLGLGRGTLTVRKSDLLGSHKDWEPIYAGFDGRLAKIRVYHSNALFGIRFYMASAPPVPPRNYLKKFVNKVSPPQTSSDVLFGNECDNYNDFDLEPGERIVKLNFRNGQWIDAVQFETSKGRVSDMFGSNGGHLSSLEAPSNEKEIVGLWGYVGAWLDGVGILYV